MYIYIYQYRWWVEKKTGTLVISTHSEMREAADPISCQPFSPWPPPTKNIVFLAPSNFQIPTFPWKNRMMLVYNLCKLVIILFLLAEVWNLEDGSSNACRLSISSVATCDFFPWTLGLPSHLVASSLGGWHVTGVWKHPRSRFAGVSATWAAVQ